MNMDVKLNKDSVSTGVDVITSMQKALNGVFWYIYYSTVHYRIMGYLSGSK